MHINELLLWLGTHVKRIIKKKLQKYIPDSSCTLKAFNKITKDCNHKMEGQYL